MIRTSFETLMGIGAFAIIIAAITYAAMLSGSTAMPTGVSGEITSSIPR